MTRENLIITWNTLLDLAEAWGFGSSQGANLIESRRIVEGELRSMGWAGEDDDEAEA